MSKIKWVEWESAHEQWATAQETVKDDLGEEYRIATKEEYETLDIDSKEIFWTCEEESENRAWAYDMYRKRAYTSAKENLRRFLCVKK